MKLLKIGGLKHIQTSFEMSHLKDLEDQIPLKI